MTDRVAYLTIALEQDIRSDDVESLIEAIQHFRYVLKVEKGISNPEIWTAKTRIGFETRQKLYKLASELSKA